MTDTNITYDDPTALIIAIPKATMDRLLKTEAPSDAVALYSFYCYTAKWQKTNQPKCSVQYVMKAFQWGEKKVQTTKNILKTLGLIVDKPQKKDGKVTGWFVHIKYISTPSIYQGVDSEGTNALNTNSLKDTKVSLVEKNSTENIHKETFTEEEFKFGEEPEKNTDPISNWIAKVTTEARNRSSDEKASQPFSIPRNDRAKYFQKIRDYLSEIQHCVFVEKNKWDDTFLSHFDKTSLEKLHGMTIEAILKIVETAIDNYLTARNNPDKYDFIGRDRKIDLGTFFYEFNENNGVLGVSHFLQYLNVELKEKNDIDGKEKMLSAIYEKDLSKMYSSVYNQYVDFSDEEMLRMVKSILSLCRWWKRNESRLADIYKGTLKIRFPKGMETFIEHYLARFIANNKFEHAISLFPEKKHWKAFGDFIYDETQIDLEAEVKTEKKKESNISIDEINRRMEAD
jgi:hypothetical protein